MEDTKLAPKSKSSFSRRDFVSGALGASLMTMVPPGVALPKSDMRSSKLIDGMVWDGKDPAKYADGFKVKA